MGRFPEMVWGPVGTDPVTLVRASRVAYIEAPHPNGTLASATPRLVRLVGGVHGACWISVGFLAVLQGCAKLSYAREVDSDCQRCIRQGRKLPRPLPVIRPLIDQSLNMALQPRRAPEKPL